MPEINRRRFLSLSAAGVAFAACGGPKKPPSSPAATAASKENLSVIPATVEVAVGDDRIAFALFNGTAPFAPAGTTVLVTPPEGNAVTVTPSVEKIAFGVGGDAASKAEVRELFVFRTPFDKAGFWSMEATFTDKGRKRSATTTFAVLDDSKSPMVGEKALASDTPTDDNHRGVEPICTRTPVCSMHSMTVAQAISSGKPSVIAFATPRFCQSRTCGPVIDIIESKRSVAPDVNFVHVEVYTNETAKELTEAMKQWEVPGEPWVVFVDAAGIVKARWSGAVGLNEFEQGLANLQAGKL